MYTDSDDPQNQKNTPDIRLLALGALAGLLMAGYGLLRQAPGSNDLPVSAVARVNDALISRDNYERALARLAEESADAATLQRCNARPGCWSD